MLGRAIRSGRHACLLVAFALSACGGFGASTDVTAAAIDPAPSPTSDPGTAPTPAPTTAGIASPSLQGLAKVSSGLSLQDYLQPSWGTGDVPGSMAPDDVGAFRFLCAPSHNAYDDPIVYPGQPGKSHLHTFFGNTKTDAGSTYESLRTTGDSSCNDMLNRSAYWVPAMMNGAGKVVMPDGLAVYYKRYPVTDARCTTFATACLPLPRGLRYVFGYNMLDPSSTPTDTTKRWWNCDGPGATTGHFATIAEALRGCPTGDRIGAVLVAPDCWNGTQLDSPDHRSHMAYRVQDGQGHAVCPKTHPYIIPEFQLGVWYSTDATTKNWYLASDRMAGMADMEPGSTIHADWFGAWDDSVIDLWTANCINKMLSCSGGDLGNGQQLKLLTGYSPTTTTTLADIPARP
ncbi:DUF1996 domain-containing protein [Sphingomonas panacisoli]|uniref:DUF1996 domain-containing protein n=1 Tax=Sphingomonas panacisoli TaxID=1813879 RepID=A0A5B8LII4_9SPHN|nr:DUF1996 domain-containing protein [Sphingomonas panacisoli]QDZ07639.1 DUF1996 domain-containing protein [Sphingomonas panacisoli]